MENSSRDRRFPALMILGNHECGRIPPVDSSAGVPKTKEGRCGSGACFGILYTELEVSRKPVAPVYMMRIKKQLGTVRVTAHTVKSRSS